MSAMMMSHLMTLEAVPSTLVACGAISLVASLYKKSLCSSKDCNDTLEKAKPVGLVSFVAGVILSILACCGVLTLSGSGMGGMSYGMGGYGGYGGMW